MCPSHGQAWPWPSGTDVPAAPPSQACNAVSFTGSLTAALLGCAEESHSGNNRDFLENAHFLRENHGTFWEVSATLGGSVVG